MPIVWTKLPNLKVYIVGNNPTSEIKDLETPNVIVTGFVNDVKEYFTTSKIFVAPLRYGAGMKGKTGHALEYALPIVSTDIGAEGMELENGLNILIANDATHFAERIIELYSNEVLWTHIHENSINALAPFTYENQKNNVKSILNFTLTEH
jgi:glycosyltransferase involved in cell wall biosynthesis